MIKTPTTEESPSTTNSSSTDCKNSFFKFKFSYSFFTAQRFGKISGFLKAVPKLGKSPSKEKAAVRANSFEQLLATKKLVRLLEIIFATQL